MASASKGECAPIPIIDIFAGPGGLGEGFSRYPMGEKKKKFRIAVSIEKDPYAHKTLTLRAFFRQFPEGETPKAYYNYLRGLLTRGELFGGYPKESKAAEDEAQRRTLGKDLEITEIIGKKIKGHKNRWILIGGPPCQAYSIAGRSRMLGLVKQKDELPEDFENRKKENTEKFEGDHRHTLYKEYLKIIADHSPAAFVMENVKGILSAKLDGVLIFPQILKDLENPQKAIGRNSSGQAYQIHSFVKSGSDQSAEVLDPKKYLIRAEKYGVPQTRHRVILLGVRSGLSSNPPETLLPRAGPNVSESIGDLPPLAPFISSKHDSDLDQTLELIKATSWSTELKNYSKEKELLKEVMSQIGSLWMDRDQGGKFVEHCTKFPKSFPLATWFKDSKLRGVCNHEPRGHMPEDLRRYFFCSCFAKLEKRSPKLREFPEMLLPNHKNVKKGKDRNRQKFADRFRVQLEMMPSKTVVSHIAGDGHYFIHYDPSQGRSLTVREAARIQTFPDNYKFEGGRTKEYHQVGNAVPPYLAHQLAAIVWQVLDVAEEGEKHTKRKGICSRPKNDGSK